MKSELLPLAVAETLNDQTKARHTCPSSSSTNHDASLAAPSSFSSSSGAIDSRALLPPIHPLSYTAALSAVAMTLALLSSIPLTHNEAASGILGSISLACWVFLLIPQLIENYRNGNADAISLSFIFIWFLGDVANLWGALWAGLVPTVIAIGVYFCIADGVLIGQVLYYRVRNKRREGKSLVQAARASVVGDGYTPQVNGNAITASTSQEDPDETEPLLSRTRSNPTQPRRRSSNITIPGSGAHSRRKSSTASHPHDHPLSKILEETTSTPSRRAWLTNTLSILGIVLVGTAGWAAAYASKAWTPTPPPSQDPDLSTPRMAAGAQVLGYLSAAAYLGARIPQIIKNYRDQSCEGLSLLFFILSLLGNLTFGLGILAHSVQMDYFVTNLPWLIGSFGTMAEDMAIFVQFHLYRVDDDATVKASEEDDEGGEIAVT